MRNILHCDLNNFYASVECRENVEYRGLPLAVCGNVDERKGIVLAKNELAKSYGVKTGQTVWEAKKLCPFLKTVETHFELYLHYSRMIRDIYLEYTDRVEPFGIDEAWLDITDSGLLGSPYEIANKIRERTKAEFGLSISVGVSFNKTIAKLASDMKKPDAVTVIGRDQLFNIVWPLPVDNLLGVGRKILDKLSRYGIDTIGKLANVELSFLSKKFGKYGEYLHSFANGTENNEVRRFVDKPAAKSIGNSTTIYRDITTRREAITVFSGLCDNIAQRMLKENTSAARTVSVHIKDSNLQTVGKRKTFKNGVFLQKDILEKALEVFDELYSGNKPIRALGVSVSNFVGELNQLSFFGLDNSLKNINLECMVRDIRNKYGDDAIKKGSKLFDEKMTSNSIFKDIHPVSFFK